MNTATQIPANLPTIGMQIKVGRRTFKIAAIEQTGNNTRRASARGGNPAIATIAAECKGVLHVIDLRANGEYQLIGKL